MSIPLPRSHRRDWKLSATLAFAYPIYFLIRPEVTTILVISHCTTTHEVARREKSYRPTSRQRESMCHPDSRASLCRSLSKSQQFFISFIRSSGVRHNRLG